MAVAFVLNGRPVNAGAPGASVTLLQWLRARGLTGTKEGCAEGECGACAVAMRRTDAQGRTRFESINSCLVPLAAVHDETVVTVEGIAPGEGLLHPVQDAMVRAGGSQCGYCTPGFVVSLFCEYLPARPRRLRSGVDQRQPVPLHRLPADRRRRADAAGAGRRRSAPGGARRAGAAADARRQRARRRAVRPPDQPRRSVPLPRRGAHRDADRRRHRRHGRRHPEGRSSSGGRLARGAARAAHLRGDARRDRARRRPDADRDRGAPARDARGAPCRCSASSCRCSRRG